MPQVSPFALLERLEQPVVYLRHEQVKVEELPCIIGDSFAELAAYVQSAGVHMTDIPYVAYEENHNTLQVITGFPLTSPVKGNGRIQAGVLSRELTVSCLYLGIYDGVGPVYAAMETWVAKQGLQRHGPSYDYYYSGPDTPPEHSVTRIVMPVVPLPVS